MQEISKKPFKKRPRVWGLLLIVVCLLCLGLLYYFSRPSELPKPVSVPKLTIWQAAPGQVSSVTLYPSSGSPYTITCRASVYALKEDPNAAVNQELAKEVFDSLSGISAIALVKDHVSDAEKKDFGVTSSSVRMEIHTEDGQSAAFSIGSLLPGDVLNWFLYDETRQAVFLTDVNYEDLCNVTINEIRPVPRVNFTPDLVNGISITGECGFGLQEKNGLWYVTAPFTYPADTEKARALISKIGKMRLAVYEGEQNKLSLSDLGLGDPRADVRISFAPSVIKKLNENHDIVSTTSIEAHEERFLIGGPAGPTGFYCLYKGVVYKATDASMGFWLKINPENYTLKTPINFQPSTLHKIVITKNGVKQEYDVTLTEQILPNNHLALAQDGTPLYTMQVARNGQEINTDVFVKNYMELTKLRVSMLSGDFSGNDKKPFLSITILYEGGKRTVDFYDADTLYAAVSVDGTILHSVEKQALESLSLLSLGQ